jgi:hypothetical protein
MLYQALYIPEGQAALSCEVVQLQPKWNTIAALAALLQAIAAAIP